MRKIRSMLALLLALLTLTGASAEEGMLAGDLAGDFNAIDGGQAEAPAADMTDIYDADLLVGYVAAVGARLNPFQCNERDLVSLNQLVFESLVALDDSQKPSPMLADNWEHQEKVWKFTLRSGITFHNGAELTAYDVQATYEQFVQIDDADNPYTPRLKQLISRMQAVDERTLAVEGKYEGYITLYAMDFPVIQSSTLYDDMPRGTGPFWYVRYDIDSAVRIEANPLWWKQPPMLGSVTFCRYETSGDAIEALQTSRVEMLSTRSSNAALCRKLSNLTSMDYGSATYEMMVPNLASTSEMSDVRTRQAVMYAIDRSVIASNAYLDMAIQSEVPILPGTWLYESQSAQYYYSPERALQLLYDAGWADLNGDITLDKLEGIRLRELEVNIITYNDSTTSMRENAANLIADYLTTVGFRVSVEVMSKDTLKKRIKNGEYDLALIGANLSEIPLLTALLGTDGNLNFNNYTSTSMGALLTQTTTAADEAGMKQVYSQLQLQLVEELPVMGLLFRAGTVLSSRSLGGLTGIRAMNVFRGLEYLSN